MPKWNIHLADRKEKFAFGHRKVRADFFTGCLAWHLNRLARNGVDDGKIIYVVDTGKINPLKF